MCDFCNFFAPFNRCQWNLARRKGLKVSLTDQIWCCYVNIWGYIRPPPISWEATGIWQSAIRWRHFGVKTHPTGDALASSKCICVSSINCVVTGFKNGVNSGVIFFSSDSMIMCVWRNLFLFSTNRILSQQKFTFNNHRILASGEKRCELSVFVRDSNVVCLVVMPYNFRLKNSREN